MSRWRKKIFLYFLYFFFKLQTFTITTDAHSQWRCLRTLCVYLFLLRWEEVWVNGTISPPTKKMIKLCLWHLRKCLAAKEDRVLARNGFLWIRCHVLNCTFLVGGDRLCTCLHSVETLKYWTSGKDDTSECHVCIIDEFGVFNIVRSLCLVCPVRYRRGLINGWDMK